MPGKPRQPKPPRQAKPAKRAARGQPASPAESAEPSPSDKNTLGGRARRYARVGTAMGGLAVRFAGGRFLGLDPDSGAQATELKNALGGLKGPLMKVAQIISTVPDLLPEEYTEQLAQLQTNAPSMGRPFVRRRMGAELGAEWAERFAEFDQDAAAAASLGQVHRAAGHDGRTLACKLQYPDMSSAVEADLRQLKLVFAIYHRYDKALDPTQIHAELSSRLREELDYGREARHMRLFAHMHATEANVHIPDLIAELSTDRLLTMSWLDGTPLRDFIRDHRGLRNAVAENMFRAWYVPFYDYGVIHGDPHLGNYTARPDGSINLFDFGCIRVFKPSFIGAVIDLYRALCDDDKDLEVHAYETWGFRDLDLETIDVLSQWARFLYQPLMTDRVQPIQETSGVTYGANVAARVHRELRRLGGVTPPREFLLMDRAAIGLGSVFTHLGAEINWHRLFHSLIDDFDEKALARRQKKALKSHGIPLAD